MAEGPNGLVYAETAYTREATRRSLAPFVDRMVEIAGRFGVESSTDQLLQRVHFINSEDEFRRRFANNTTNPEHEIHQNGIRTPEGIFLNSFRLLRVAHASGLSMDAVNRHVVLHEIGHELSYEEREEAAIGNEGKLTRSGILVLDEDLPYAVQHGSYLLNEGAMETLVVDGLNSPSDLLARGYGYAGEFTVIDAIHNAIGKDVVYRAVFTKEGKQEFNDRLNDEFGPRVHDNQDAFGTIATTMQRDFKFRTKRDQEKYRETTQYRDTLRLLAGRHSKMQRRFPGVFAALDPRKQ